MYTRLLLESLRRGTRRKLLAVTAVALGTLGATALAEVMFASGDRLAAELSAYGANIELLPAPGQETLAVARLPEVRKIFWRNNIVALAPLYPLRLRLRPLGVPGRSGEAGTEGVVAEAIGTWFDHPLEPGAAAPAAAAAWRSGLPRTRPTLRVAGRWPRDGFEGFDGHSEGRDNPDRPGGRGESEEAAIGRRLALRLGVAVGSRLRAELGPRGLELAVVGLVTSGGEEDDAALLPLAAVEWLAGQPGRFTRAEIYAQTNPEVGNQRDPRRMTPKEYETWYCTAYPSSVAFQLGQALPEARAKVVYGLTAATAEVLGKLRGVLLALALVALAGAAVGVTAAMTATVLERRLEAGLLVAIGAARRRVVFFFLSEAALLGGWGGLLGGALGLLGGRLLGSTVLGVTVPWMPVLLPFAAGLGLLIAVLGSLLPVTRALGRYPAALLKRATA
ncbi:MAG TPA: FtsX-like permease family protein [Thermoanaerobaculia bacterium]|nr:FtsX-like permease family protein [Thermoanaerobaculia bacterium]